MMLCRRTVVLIFIAATAVSISVSGCSGKKNYSDIQNQMNGWANTLKNRDFAGYRAFEAYPKGPDQFADMYKEYYITDITVMDVSKESDERRAADGRLYTGKTVTFGADIVMRKDGGKIPSSGTVEMIRFADSGQKWFIADKTITRTK